MNKIKVGTSVIILLVLCLFFHNFLVLMNYFLALFLHEMGHLIVATRRGYVLRQFRIDLFGMAIDIDSDIDSKDCFVVNVAGPVINLLFAGICVIMYYVLPITYQYLHIFCVANISLAIFNLLPIYPLDGGKIFRGMLRDDIFRKCDFIIRVGLGSMFALIFICSLPNINWFSVLFIIFLINTRDRGVRIGRIKDNLMIRLVELDGNVDIYSALKHIDDNSKSIFYIGNMYLVEDRLYNLALKYPLNTKLKDILIYN